MVGAGPYTPSSPSKMSTRLRTCALLSCSAWLHFAACGLVGVATAYAYVWIAQVRRPCNLLAWLQCFFPPAVGIGFPRSGAHASCCAEAAAFLPLPPAPRRSTTLTTTMNLSSRSQRRPKQDTPQQSSLVRRPLRQGICQLHLPAMGVARCAAAEGGFCGQCGGGWNSLPDGSLRPCPHCSPGLPAILSPGLGVGLEATALPVLVMSCALISSYWLGNTSGERWAEGAGWHCGMQPPPQATRHECMVQCRSSRHPWEAFPSKADSTPTLLASQA